MVYRVQVYMQTEDIKRVLSLDLKVDRVFNLFLIYTSEGRQTFF